MLSSVGWALLCRLASERYLYWPWLRWISRATSPGRSGWRCPRKALPGGVVPGFVVIDSYGAGHAGHGNLVAGADQAGAVEPPASRVDTCRPDGGVLNGGGGVAVSAPGVRCVMAEPSTWRENSAPAQPGRAGRSVSRSRQRGLVSHGSVFARPQGMCGARSASLIERRIVEIRLARPSISRKHRPVRPDFSPCAATAGVCKVRWMSKRSTRPGGPSGVYSPKAGPCGPGLAGGVRTESRARGCRRCVWAGSRRWNFRRRSRGGRFRHTRFRNRP